MGVFGTNRQRDIIAGLNLAQALAKAQRIYGDSIPVSGHGTK